MSFSNFRIHFGFIKGVTKVKFKTIAAALIAAGLSTAALAQSNIKTNSNWEFYGRAHLSFDKLDDGDAYQKQAFSSNSSRIGFKGSKQFADLKGIWQVEQEILFNMTDTAASDKNRLATRDTFAGVEGSFGTVRFGKFDTPFKVSREPANLFGDQLGDMRNITRGLLKFEERPNNIIEYKSPEFSGMRVAVAYAPHEAKQPEAGKDNGLTSLSLTYNNKDLTMAVANESYDKDATNGERNATRLAASYKVTPTFRVVGVYQQAKDKKNTGSNDLSNKVTGYGAEYHIDPNKLLVKFNIMDLKADVATKDAKMTVVGIEKIVDKQLRFYANYAVTDNASGSKVTVWKEGRSTDQTGVNGKEAKGLSLGMRFDF